MKNSNGVWYEMNDERVKQVGLDRVCFYYYYFIFFFFFFFLFIFFFYFYFVNFFEGFCKII